MINCIALVNPDNIMFCFVLFVCFFLLNNDFLHSKYFPMSTAKDIKLLIDCSKIVLTLLIPLSVTPCYTKIVTKDSGDTGMQMKALVSQLRHNRPTDRAVPY